MIATARILRLRPASPGDLRRAVRAVVAYVEGGQPGTAAGLAGYYDRASGRARGQLAELVGLRGEVSSEALSRLLEGRHAVSGRPLLAAAGSAARAHSARDACATRATSGAGPYEAGELLTLTQASALAGVSATYLRSLVAKTARAHAGQAADDVSDSPARAEDGNPTREPPAGQNGHAAVGGLVGVKGVDGRWRVRRDEVERWVAARVASAAVLGFDVVCAAPKSVSLLWAFGDEVLRADVAAALDAAVDATIGYLERHAAFGKIGGHNRPSRGLAVASYLHDVSRSVEAHLHVHNIVINAVVVAAGDDEPGASGWEWRAVDGEVLLSHVRTAGFVGAAVLRRELAVRRGLEWGPVRNGVAELAAFPADLLAAFSTRHREVAEEFAQIVAAGLEPSGATMTAAQRGSRAPKTVLADETVRRLQVERLEEAGWTVGQVRQLAAGGEHRPPAIGDDDVAELFTLLAGPKGLTEKATTFGRREIVRQIAAWGGDRLDAEAIDRLADRFPADSRVVHLQAAAPGQRRRAQPEPLYTVEDMLDTEQRLRAVVREGRVVAGAAPRVLASPRVVDAFLAAADGFAGSTRPAAAGRRGAFGAHTIGANGAGSADVVLSAEQAELVRRLLADQDLVRVAVGAAGTGKTEAMRVLTAIVRAEGHPVFATAHGGRQAEQLADRIGVPARVVASWLTLLDAIDADPARQLADVWPAGSVLIVDEATQVGTRDAERLLDYAARTGTVVILLGDPAQLGSVAAGGWFLHLIETTPDVPTLTTVHRQAGADMAPIRAALDALRAETGTPIAALDRLATAGKIHLVDDPDTLFTQAVTDWYAERRRHLGTTAPQTQTADGSSGPDGARPPPARPPKPIKTHLMAERHRDVEALNRAARTLLTADGTLTGPALTVAGRDFQVGDEVVTLTQAGHTLIPAGRPGSAYIRTGTIGVITDLHLDADNPPAQTVTVYFPSKGTVVVPWTYLTHQFDDGRDGGLAHAYALTAAKAQGSMMDTARALVTDDTSRAGLYVMLSRARTDLAAYLIRRDDLAARDDDENWLPATAGPLDAISRLAGHLERSEPEHTAAARDPIATAAHQLRATHTLAELTALRLSRRIPQPRPGPRRPAAPAPTTARRAGSGSARTPGSSRQTAPNAPFEPSHTAPSAPFEPSRATPVEPQPRATPSRSARSAPNKPADTETGTAGPKAGPAATAGHPYRGGSARSRPPWQVVLRRAELAAEAAIRTAALADPPDGLVDRIGTRPAAGPQRAIWDAAVGGLAVYHARHTPAAPTWTAGPPPGATPHDRAHDPWLQLHDQAVHLAEAWAAAFSDPVRAGFIGPGQTVPRQRAIAGLHALLDTGHPPSELAAALRQGPIHDVQTAAALLDHRVADLCHQSGTDPTLYDLPAPTTAQHEWNSTFDLLTRAETTHLATRPTHELATQHRTLTKALTRTTDQAVAGLAMAADSSTAQRLRQGEKTELENRLRRVEAALDRQVTDALLHAQSEPAGYLTALLGPRPHDSGADAMGWDQAAGRVEHYRHHALGLPYGTPAQPDTADPTRHALDDRPTNPADAAHYDQAHDIADLHGGQLTLD
ncbi:MobF family relaxase [Pseudofrankia inefficax]|uniref:TrwC relaxase n=1 Tax=Pseudofrankia inefficax (strain DSM 45817 / CECT 9037 / DDB 130130 / EuI1c) TaxID=298654 RepID=E3IVX7_PSEI1|nr:MobF family relaxase [Pseudofrankia inefficax]ADP84905.1 TrwC relaxase [Pseudofrankia inefficax]